MSSPSEEMEKVLVAVSRMQKAAVKIQAGKLDFENPAFLEVMFSSDSWSPFEEMGGFVTRVTDRDSENRIVALEAKWYESAFFPPHYHNEQETVTILSGHATFFTKKGSGKTREIVLEKGGVVVFEPGEFHAGYIHAGTWLTAYFLPPIPQAVSLDLK